MKHKFASGFFKDEFLTLKWCSFRMYYNILIFHFRPSDQVLLQAEQSQKVTTFKVRKGHGLLLLKNICRNCFWIQSLQRSRFYMKNSGTVISSEVHCICIQLYYVELARVMHIYGLCVVASMIGLNINEEYQTHRVTESLLVQLPGEHTAVVSRCATQNIPVPLRLALLWSGFELKGLNSQPCACESSTLCTRPWHPQCIVNMMANTDILTLQHYVMRNQNFNTGSSPFYVSSDEKLFRQGVLLLVGLQVKSYRCCPVLKSLNCHLGSWKGEN
jgi:hypothetical protein